MILSKYGISLIRLKEEHIELVRIKRNSDAIRTKMRYREIIAPQSQLEWFHSINNIYNNYFIIKYKNNYIGLINGSNINFDKRSSEGGVFIWDTNYINTLIPSLCSVILNDCNFIINNFETSYITVLKNNKKAIAYNKIMGYTPTNYRDGDNESCWYQLTRKNYLLKSDKLRNAIAIATNDPLPLSINDISFCDDTNLELETLYNPLPLFMRAKVDTILKREGRSF